LKVLHVAARSTRWSRPVVWRRGGSPAAGPGQAGGDVRLLLPGLPAILDAVHGAGR